MAKKISAKRKKHLFFWKLLAFIFIICTVIMNGLCIYNGMIPDFIMMIIGIVSIIISLFFTVVLCNIRVKSGIKFFVSLFLVAIMAGEIFFMRAGFDVSNIINQITDNGKRVEEIGIYVLKSSNYKKINDLEGKSINYLSTGDDENVRKALTIFEQKTTFESDYDESMDDLLNKLFNNEIDAIILSTSYEDIIKDEYKDKYEDLVMIYSESIENVVNVKKSNADITKDPFIVYVSGIDTNGKISSKARSDVNILIAVNPTTHNILVLNTPRDYYVTFHTKGVKDKLTHAGVFGVEESLKTLADFYEVDIDYYVRINFTSFIKIVDALDGVTVNVEGSFCESDSYRNTNNKICLSKGTQKLNGKQALAYARNRHSFNGGDKARGNHQMQIIEAIINKATSPKIITNYSRLIESLNNQVKTNMTSEEMLKFAKKQVSKNADWDFNSIAVDGSNSSNRCYAVGSGKAYVMEPNIESVDAAKQSLKNLLSGKKDIVVTTTTTRKK